MKYLIAPTEVDLTRELGTDAVTSSVPESIGADIVIPLPQGIFGIQRKEIPHDFLLSFFDGRLTRETSLLRDKCKFRLLLCEGQFRYYENGLLVKNKNLPGDFTKKQIWGILFDIKFIKGVEYDFTRSTAETAEYIRYIADYFSKDKHMALFARPDFESELFTPSVDEFHMWVLQSFPGIGPATADNILKALNRMPIRWDCTLEELQSVPRLGKTAEKIYNMIPHVEQPISEHDIHGKDIHGKDIHGKDIHGKDIHRKDIHRQDVPDPVTSTFDALRDLINGGSDAEGMDVP